MCFSEDCLLPFFWYKNVIPQQKLRFDLMKSCQVAAVSLRENYVKKFKSIMEGNSNIKLVSTMFSLCSHWSIYVFNTEGLSGALTEGLLKQSPAYAARLGAHKHTNPARCCSRGGDTRVHVHWYSSRGELMLWFTTWPNLYKAVSIIWVHIIAYLYCLSYQSVSNALQMSVCNFY